MNKSSDRSTTRWCASWKRGSIHLGQCLQDEAGIGVDEQRKPAPAKVRVRTASADNGLAPSTEAGGTRIHHHVDALPGQGHRDVSQDS